MSSVIFKARNLSKWNTWTLILTFSNKSGLLLVFYAVAPANEVQIQLFYYTDVRASKDLSLLTLSGCTQHFDTLRCTIWYLFLQLLDSRTCSFLWFYHIGFTDIAPLQWPDTYLSHFLDYLLPELIVREYEKDLFALVYFFVALLLTGFSWIRLRLSTTRLFSITFWNFGWVQYQGSFIPNMVFVFNSIYHFLIVPCRRSENFEARPWCPPWSWKMDVIVLADGLGPWRYEFWS